jgi:hypothetical protein
MMTAEDIRTEFGWNDDMIHSLLQTPRPGVAKAKAYRHMSITTANECWASLYRRRASLPNGGGMRRHRVRAQTQVGRHDSAIWDACWASRRSLSGSSWSDLDIAPTFGPMGMWPGCET